MQSAWFEGDMHTFVYVTGLTLTMFRSPRSIYHGRLGRSTHSAIPSGVSLMVTEHKAISGCDDHIDLHYKYVTMSGATNGCQICHICHTRHPHPHSQQYRVRFTTEVTVPSHQSKDGTHTQTTWKSGRHQVQH